MGPKKDNSIAVALIGAAAVVIAALIGYWATHSKPDPVLVDYTGKVKDANYLKPIGQASVAITEDQKPPQRFTTDSEGIFYARLSKDTQKMLLEVQARGYQDYSRTGPTVRTGSEDIFLEPVPPPSIPQQDPPEAELEKLRKLHKVSLISPQESDKPPAEIPKNSYGFAWSYALTLKPLIKLTILDSREVMEGNSLFELHKLSDGHIELVGFVGPETFARYRMGLKSGEHITFYSVSWSDAHNVASVPLSSLVCPQDRDANYTVVLECSIR
jgi:hypothetical protein